MIIGGSIYKCVMGFQTGADTFEGLSSKLIIW